MYRESKTQWSVLLVYHKRFNTWLPVGGELHHGEMPSMGAQREVEEETGIDTDSLVWIEHDMPGAPVGLMGYEEHHAGTKGWHLNFVFQAISSTKEVKLCDEHTQSHWFTEGDLILYDLLPNVKYCLNEIYG
jgi:8-oxo-dGTP diphosphatase